MERREERDKRKEKKGRKREWQKAQQLVLSKDVDSGTPKKTALETSATVGSKRMEREEADEDGDWEELAREERLAKKVKRGAVDSKAFDEEFSSL